MAREYSGMPPVQQLITSYVDVFEVGVLTSNMSTLEQGYLVQKLITTYFPLNNFYKHPDIIDVCTDIDFMFVHE